MNDFKESRLGLIPNDWVISKAKDYCKTVTDGTHDTPKATNEGHFLVTSKNLKNGEIDFSTSYKISPREFKDINRRSKVDQFDVLFGMIGTVGNPTIVYENPVDFAIKNVGLFKLNGDIKKSKWLYIFLSSYIFTNFLKKQQAGTTQQFVGLGFLRKIPVIFPKKPEEQTAIAGILSKVDEAIKSIQNSIKTAEKLKKSLMQNLLTGKLKPDGTWRNEDEFYIDEKMGKVPVGWSVERFGKRVIVKYGKSQKEIVSETGKIPIYGTGGIMEYGTDFLCDRESILIGRKGTIDKPYYINTPFWAVDTTYYVDSFEKGNMKFLFLLLIKKKLKTLNEATGVPSITRRTLNRQLFCFPPETEQKAISNKFEIIDNKITQKQTKINKLERLKKSLLQNLLTGKKRVDVEKINQLLNAK